METESVTITDSSAFITSREDNTKRRVKFINPADQNAGSGEGVILERRGKVLVIATDAGKIIVPVSLVYEGQEHIPPLSEKTLTTVAAAQIAIQYLSGERTVPGQLSEYDSMEEYEIGQYEQDEYRQSCSYLKENLPDRSWVKFTTPQGEYGFMVAEYTWEDDCYYKKLFHEKWEAARPSFKELAKRADKENMKDKIKEIGLALLVVGSLIGLVVLLAFLISSPG